MAGGLLGAWRQKAVSDVDKTNEFVTMHCPEGHCTKQADKNKKWDCFCDICNTSMVEEYELKHNTGKQLERQNNQS